MHDIKFIRDNPEAFDAGLARRGMEPQAAEIIALDTSRREAESLHQTQLAERNRIAKEIGMAKAAKDEAKFAELMELRNRIGDAAGETGEQFANQIRGILEIIPNLPAPDVPEGADEKDNVEVSRWGTPRSFVFAPKEHADLGPALGLDFETGALLSGARFTFLRGQMARLQRAIGQFMIDHQTGVNGYSECSTPVLVRDEAMYGTDKLPKFAEDSFRTTDGRWLIPTSEVTLTASVMGQILDDAALPIRMTALSLCFRSEAGAAGKDTRGFIRQHQFEKCELVSVTRPEDSEAEHERMTAAAESILQALELPYRKVLLCTGDMGFGARKTYDLEVWLPGQDTYREISSCSNCGDFQARRMNTRYRPEGAKGTEFVHTLNGSGLAVGRTLVAVLENYQQADGSVEVPSALLPYMGGITSLVPA